jgi:DNA-binding NarL/FixJ family response regulator
MAGTLKVLLADDHRLMLAAARRVLERHDDFEIVGEVMRGTQVVPAVTSLDPDVVLLDVRMPGLDGIACLKRLRAHGSKVPVVVISSYVDDEHVEAARSAGATAYVGKTIDPAELPEIVRAAAAGAPFTVVRPPAARDGSNELSDRELTVLAALTRGLSNRQIGEELWVSEQTIKFHLRNVYRKIDVKKRAEAVRWAYSHGIGRELSRVAQ